MNVKSLNIILNDYCNSRCTSCGIWKNSQKNELSAEDIKSLSKKEEFSTVEEISLSGGEPLLIEDIDNILGAAVNFSPGLKKVFLNHNGTRPEKAKELVRKYAELVPEFYLCASIDGPKEIHDEIRGIHSFDNALKTLDACDSLLMPNYHAMISSTIQRKNSGLDNLAYLIELAKGRGIDFSFRFIAEAKHYYNNEGVAAALGVPTEQMKKILRFVSDKGLTSPFLEVQRAFYFKGKNDVVEGENGEILCKAGNTFVSVFPDKKIYPCIYSSRAIGNVIDGIVDRPLNLARYAPCPCEPTECVIYPMLNYSGLSSE